MILRVRCDACGRDAPHATTTIFFDPERHGVDPNDGILTPQVLTCPHCGAEDEYTIDPTSAIEVATRALAAARLPETSSRGPWAVQLGRASLEDGTPIRRASDGLRILRQRAEARPSDPSGWRRLGNYAIRCDRFDEALDAWRRGAEIPRDFDCALAVAMEAVSRRTPAFDAVARAVERLPHADVSRRPLQAAQLAEAVRLVRDERPLTLSLGPIAIDLQSIEDWSRLGELLASKRVHSVTLRREPVADPVSLAVAAERLG